MSEPSNDILIQEYLDFYKHSLQSIKMRKASLNYFFNNIRGHEGYKKHIFEITTQDLKDYFKWLKNLDIVSISTRKNKWNVLISFLNYTMEDHEEFLIKIPSRTISWNGAIIKKGEIKSNKNIFATKEEIEKIMGFLKTSNFKHYIIFRLLVETGMRKGELINLKISELNIEERYLNPHEGKTGEKYYIFSEELQKYLRLYLSERLNVKSREKNLFLTKNLKPYSTRTFNIILKNSRKQLGIKKCITCHTFRRTLNDFRKEMGCPLEDRKELLGHKLRDVNVSSYTNSDSKRLRELHDKWNPYINLNL